MLLRILSPLFFTFLSFNITAQSISPDTVYLVDGTFLTGEILNQGSENSIQLKNNDGAIIYIKNQRIDKLILNPNRPIAQPVPPRNNKEQYNYTDKAFDSDASYRKRLLALNVCLGIPVGAFGSSSISKNSAGGALPGLGIEARYLKKIDTDLYWSINLRYVKYGFNTLILYPTILQQTSLFPISFSRASWESISVGGGLNWFHTFSHDFKISLGASFYFQSVKIPLINVLLNGGTGTFEAQKGLGITPDLLATIIYKERFFMKINFSTSKVTFYSSSNPGQASFVQPMRAFGLGLGVFLPKLRS